MNKKILLIMGLILIIILVACKKEQTFTLPNLSNHNETMIATKLPEESVTYTIIYEESPSIFDGLFIRYGKGKAGDNVVVGTQIEIYVSKTKPTLPNLSGKDKTFIETELSNLKITYSFEYELDNAKPVNQFIRYGDGLTHGQKLEYGQAIVVYLVTNDPQLPNLENKNQAEIENILSDNNINYEIKSEINNGIIPGNFVRYGDNLSAGDFIEEDQIVEVYVSINDPKLPNLSNMDQAEIETTLSDLDINFEFVLIFDAVKENGTFVAIESNHHTNDFISSTETVIIQVSARQIILPDLAGLNSLQIRDLFLKIKVSHTFQTVLSINDIPDQTFYKYDNYDIDDLYVGEDSVVVLIGYNDPQLPNLEGLNIQEIKVALENNSFYNYSFTYQIDDSREQDTFVSYMGGLEGGDYIQDPVAEVGIILYDNTITKQEESLIISKYLEGGGNNQAIELFNPTEDDIDLSDYYIAILDNGSTRPTKTISLSGILQPNTTHILVNNDAARPLKNTTGSGQGTLLTNLIFDGNDVIQLRYKNHTYIDILSTVGTSTYYSTNELMTRVDGVIKGTRNFTLYEWDGYIPTYYDSIHTHPVIRPTVMQMDYSLIGNTFGSHLGAIVGVTVQQYYDGDTTAFNPGFILDQRVRYLGVDTPEMSPVTEPHAQDATNFLRGLLEEATNLYLQSDPALGYKDNYGRHLAYVWADGVMLNYEIIKAGYSLNYLGTTSNLVFGYRYIHQWFADAEEYARQNNLGIHQT